MGPVTELVCLGIQRNLTTEKNQAIDDGQQDCKAGGLGFSGAMISFIALFCMVAPPVLRVGRSQEVEACRRGH